MRIRKNDMVMAMSGTSAGKPGKVLEVHPTKDRALVEGLNIVSKAMRKTKNRPEGGIITREASLPMSVLLLFCPECKKGVRIKVVADKDGRGRACKKCGHKF